MKIVYIGTYFPRECGIATFTRNKVEAMMKNEMEETHEPIVVAINDRGNEYNYPPEVKFTIQQDLQPDYIAAAEFINQSGADFCILEHEFGIFGGQSGVYILSLLHHLDIPVISVLHTVLKSPSNTEKAILKEIDRMSSRIVVMSHKAINFLTTIYNISRSKIELVPHGIPSLQFDQQEVKKELGLCGKVVVLTFGLIGRNKGIETVLKALPPVVKRYPNLVYIVLGKTHPSVVKYAGEEYRNYLQHLIGELKLNEHVLFINEFVDENKLSKYLSATDIYVTPYLNEAQITSGTLAYAVGAGCAVISTPYWHATELLAEGRGRLFDFNDHRQLSSIFLSLLGNRKEMFEMRQRAKNYGYKTTWPRIGDRYHAIGRNIVQEYIEKSAKKDTVFDPVLLPAFSLEHVERLTDDTGIIQHAKFGVPNLKEGYCLDDNARALLMVLMAHKQRKHSGALKLLPVYISFISYMQNEDGTFHNFLSFNRNYLDDVGSEDSFGRTIWALGYLQANSPAEAYAQAGREIFFKAAQHFDKLISARGIANTIIGISYYLRHEPSDAGMTEKLRSLAYKLFDHYSIHCAENWKWFENVLTYDNAILPLAILHAGHTLKDEKLEKIAIESIHFLSGLTVKKDCLSVIGNQEWYLKNGTQSTFAQQPIDVMVMVLMFHNAYLITRRKLYWNNLVISFRWFFGENDLRMTLYDNETKGCCDGLESYGVNRNQGAESTLAYLISHLTILQAFEENYDKVNATQQRDFVHNNFADLTASLITSM